MDHQVKEGVSNKGQTELESEGFGGRILLQDIEGRGQTVQVAE
jgi:hypothetical protein